MCHELLSKQGVRAAFLGTLGLKLAEGLEKTLHHTTPDPETLFSLFSILKEKAYTHLIMEVSSHALIQHRIGPIIFDVIVFTSFSRDHLDYHESMQKYWQAKESILTQHANKKTQVFINKSVFYSKYIRLQLISHLNCQVYSYETLSEQNRACQQTNDFYLELSNNPEDKGYIPFSGRYNANNFLASLLVCRHLKYKTPSDLWPCVSMVPGRMEILQATNNRQIIIDFAHTPDALKNVLKTLKEKTKEDLFLFLVVVVTEIAVKDPLWEKLQLNWPIIFL